MEATQKQKDYFESLVQKQLDLGSLGDFTPEFEDEAKYITGKMFLAQLELPNEKDEASKYIDAAVHGKWAELEQEKYNEFHDQVIEIFGGEKALMTYVHEACKEEMDKKGLVDRKAFFQNLNNIESRPATKFQNRVLNLLNEKEIAGYQEASEKLIELGLKEDGAPEGKKVNRIKRKSDEDLKQILQEVK